MAVNHTTISLGHRQFLVKWGNVSPGDRGDPFDAGQARIVSCQSYLNLEGRARVKLMASNDLGAPDHAIEIIELADRGAASLVMIPMRARWYFPLARAGSLNTGSMDVILLFEKL